ncbi:hypothetical protein RJ640_029009 [Escallonia rubra]|uniref:Uncharacterized protein n=1 Tax=Escallonia rubra TaxID=112253 RepID=A0AA88RTK3_9ASTE|nr:hypothetical protein RJ640_029009 [Escallonia rubra]
MRRSSSAGTFASWAQSSAVFRGQIKDLGLLATLLNYINPFFLPGRGLEVPTTTPHYTWLYTFTELTPVQCLAELRGLQSLLFIPIFAQANGALLIQGGEWSLEKHC